MEGKFCFDYNFDFSDSSAVQECLEHLSSTKSGICLDEFRELVNNVLTDPEGKCVNLPDETSAELFCFFDSNGDGKLDAREFEVFVNLFIKPLVRPVTALLVIDMQNDFIDGSLAVKQEGKNIIPVINNLTENVKFDLIAYSLDYHPPNHISFFENLKHHKLSKANKCEENIAMFDTVLFQRTPEVEQKLWPVHCVQDTWGCELHKDLNIKKDAVFVYKGQNPAVDSYSAFFDNMKGSPTNLPEELRKRNISHVFVCGIAFDYCVAFTALDSLNLGYPTVIIEDGTVGTDESNIEAMKGKLKSQNCIFCNSKDIYSVVTGKIRSVEFVSVLLKRLKGTSFR